MALQEEPNVSQPHNDKSSSSTYMYGWGIFQPKCLQRVMNNAKAFLILLTLANVMQGIAINGLLKVSVTSIERRFNLQSSESGLIISAYDIAGCLSLLPISYLGGRGHKPRWIGMGVIITSFGFFMLALPHFLTGPYEYNLGKTSNTNAARNVSDVMICQEISSNSVFSSGDSSQNLTEDCSSVEGQLIPYLSINQMKYVFILGQFLTGTGCTPLAVLGVTFIDESVDPQVYPMYIGIYYMGALIGPAIGFILGGQLLTMFTELHITPNDITPESSQWVGAWWIGFVISALIMLLFAFPILGYPKQLPSNFTRKLTMIDIKAETSSTSQRYNCRNDRIVTTGVVKHNLSTNEAQHTEFHQLRELNAQQIMKEQSIPLHSSTPHENSQSNDAANGDEDQISGWLQCDRVRKFIRDMLIVVTHKAFIYLSLAAAVLGTLVSGFSTFGPKFIESQFGKSASDAANLFGFVCIPAGACGMLIGAFLMSCLKMEYRSSLRMCFCVSIFGLFAQFALTLHCDDSPLAGVNHPYGEIEALAAPPLLSRCNEQCNCNSQVFDPVCGSDSITYYSSCFAGCHHVVDTENLSKGYFNCSCVEGISGANLNATPLNDSGIATEFLGTATQGKCSTICVWHNVILTGLFLVISTTFLCAVPGVDLSLRCFPQELRSLAVGVQWILIRTLGTIPGPIIFGAMIDGTCLIWNKRVSCSDRPGSCLMYKNQELSFSLLILSVIYKGASILFFGLALLTYKPARLVASESETQQERHSSDIPL
ncbi:solute carrier organic anion transporter family member 4A1-like [Clavelina lepadiformis]|uniref:solute carrier organic anion transporter family member 4A1-like n=1 Tax=Clavelina lepadiformis TaxID=159417 RepID=UPI004042FEB7